MTVICVLGPGMAASDEGRTRAALDGGDGRHVLVDDRPQPLAQVWQDVLRPQLEGADAALLIHPSWWPAPRVELVRAAASEIVGQVTMRARATVLGHRRPGALVVEIAEHTVLVSRGQDPVVAHRRDGSPEALVHQVAARVRARTRAVLVDNPDGVPGATVLAASLGAALRTHRISVSIAGDCEITAAAHDLVDRTAPPLPPPRRRLLGSLPVALGLVLVIGVVLLARPDSAAHPATAALVEGRLSVEVPHGWLIQRVTDGPGSARVQVVSPVDPDAMLHVTQSGITDADLAATAAALRRAMDQQPGGVFVDFHPADTRAGRPAVTYREIRPGRDITWTVLVDGDLRISIGCQRASGRPDQVQECDRAVRTARRLR